MERWKICKDVRKPEDSRQANSEKAGQDSGFDARGPCRTGKERVGLKAGGDHYLEPGVAGKEKPTERRSFPRHGLFWFKKEEIIFLCGVERRFPGKLNRLRSFLFPWFPGFDRHRQRPSLLLPREAILPKRVFSQYTPHFVEILVPYRSFIPFIGLVTLSIFLADR